MNYVYRYIDTADNNIKYIGIVCRDTEDALEKRIYEHSYMDEWCQGKTWRIEYITVPTKNDAHALEGHFIALYGTSKYFNKSKTTLGLLSFVKRDFKWITIYETYRTNRTETYKYDLSQSCKKSLALRDKLAENYANIIHSIKIVNLMLDNEIYSMYSREELLKDLEILQDGKRKYESYMDIMLSKTMDTLLI